MVQSQDTDFEMVDLYQSLSIYHDVDGNKNIAEIEESADWFAANDTEEGYQADDVYWTRLLIPEGGFQGNELLHFSANNWDQSWEQIDVWIYGENGLLDRFQLGNKYDTSIRPVRSALNLLELPYTNDEPITIICRLAGVSEKRKPNRVSFFLLNPDYYPGYMEGYPFKGSFAEETSRAAFRTNAITDFEILETEEDFSIDAIARNWSQLQKTPLFDVTHEANSKYWIKLQLEGSQYLHGQQILHISSAPGNDQFSFDYIDTYTSRNDDVFVHQRTGDQVGLEDRPFHFWANFIKVEILPTDSVTLYIRMEGVDKRFLMSHIIVHHVDATSLFPKQSNEAWAHGIFVGILGIQCVFFLLLAIVGKEAIYLYFTIMAFGFFLVMNSDDNMFSRFVAFPELRNYHVIMFYLGLFLSQVGFFNFTRIYFDYKSKRVKRRILVFLLVSGIVHINGFMQLQFASDISGYSKISHSLVALSILSGILAVIAMASMSRNVKRVNRLLFLSAFIPLTIAAFMSLGRPILIQLGQEELINNQVLWANNADFVKLSIIFMLTMLAISVGLRTIKLKMDKETALKFKEKNKIIEAKSKQNEILVKEIHHRVKNNLQILSSLLNLQVDHLTDDSAIDALQEGRNRVESMGMIHQKLYSTDNVTSVDMREYTADLCRYLEDSFSSPDKGITIKEDIQYSYMDVDYAIPLGLIINELVTNSVKYAFPVSGSGEILINLKEIGEQLILKVSDNGSNASDPGNVAINASFGTKLIKTLCKKLKGNISIETAQGYATTIAFDRYKFL